MRPSTGSRIGLRGALTGVLGCVLLGQFVIILTMSGWGGGGGKGHAHTTTALPPPDAGLNAARSTSEQDPTPLSVETMDPDALVKVKDAYLAENLYHKTLPAKWVEDPLPGVHMVYMYVNGSDPAVAIPRHKAGGPAVCT